MVLAFVHLFSADCAARLTPSRTRFNILAEVFDLDLWFVSIKTFGSHDSILSGLQAATKSVELWHHAGS
jgi:hypothetical protein